MREILQIAFKGHLIDSPDHPVVEASAPAQPDQISPCLIIRARYSAHHSQRAGARPLLDPAGGGRGAASRRTAPAQAFGSPPLVPVR